MPVLDDSIAEQLFPTRLPTFVEEVCRLCNAQMELTNDKAEPCCSQCGLTAREAMATDKSKAGDVQNDPQATANGFGWYRTDESIDGNVKYLDLPKGINASNLPPLPKAPAKTDGGMPFKKNPKAREEAENNKKKKATS